MQPVEPRPAAILPTGGPLVFVHAHPDDETIATGVLLAALAAAGRDCHVLTATRGERGEVRAGVHVDDLTALREGEWATACRTLGVAGAAFLGTPPARAAGLAPRRYLDSGMVWLDAAETLAGPAPDASPDSLTSADAAEVAADIAAYARSVGAVALFTYDELGGYGHPDHVALVAPCRAAASELGIGCWEIVSQPRPGATTQAGPADARFDLAAHRDTVVAALGAYASQVRVEGNDIVHVGGQREPLQLTIGVRRPS